MTRKTTKSKILTINHIASFWGRIKQSLSSDILESDMGRTCSNKLYENVANARGF